MIPVDDNGAALEEMNVFLRSHRILEEQHELISGENCISWHFCLKYLEYGESSTGFRPKRKKVDYRHVLDEKAFARFSNLRELRKQIAKEEAIPAYAVFLDEELAEIAKIGELSIAKIKEIKGIGEMKLKKYGVMIFDMYKDRGAANNAKSG
jgi:superfamily II DNA helicase RecQ